MPLQYYKLVSYFCTIAFSRHLSCRVHTYYNHVLSFNLEVTSYTVTVCETNIHALYLFKDFSYVNYSCFLFIYTFNIIYSFNKYYK